MDKRLVLMYLRPCSVTDVRVAGVHVNCIAAGAPHYYVLLDPHETPSHAHELLCGYATGVSPLASPEGKPWLLPPVDSYSEP